jgi:hypothetical protein
VCNAAVFNDAVNLENSLKNISRTIKPRLNQADQVNGIIEDSRIAHITYA